MEEMGLGMFSLNPNTSSMPQMNNGGGGGGGSGSGGNGPPPAAAAAAAGTGQFIANVNHGMNFIAAPMPNKIPLNKSPKSVLVELFQGKQRQATWTTEPINTNGNESRFRCILKCPAVEFGNGEIVPEMQFQAIGRSKKLADHAAAEKALQLYHQKQHPQQFQTIYAATTTPVQVIQPPQAVLNPQSQQIIIDSRQPITVQNHCVMAPISTISNNSIENSQVNTSDLSNGHSSTSGALMIDDTDSKSVLDFDDVNQVKANINDMIDIDEIKEQLRQACDEIINLKEYARKLEERISIKEKAARSVEEAMKHILQS